MTSNAPRSFGLVLRVPGWVSGADVDVESTNGEDDSGHGVEVVRAADRIELRGSWSEHRVRVQFAVAPSIGRDARGEGFVRWGPRVLALPIPDRTTVTTDHGVAGLVDVAVEPASAEHATLRLVDDAAALRVVPGGVEAAFRAGGHSTAVRRTLTPLGSAALRRVTFPLESLGPVASLTWGPDRTKPRIAQRSCRRA